MAFIFKLILLVTKWTRLPIVEQWLVIKVAMIFVTLRLGMFLVSLRQLQSVLGWLAAIARKLQQGNRQDDRNQILWVTSRLGANFLTNRSCLTEALTVQLLFWRRGYSADLRIGVSKQQNGKLIAHAWVESEGEVVIGAVDELPNYAVLPSLAYRKQSKQS
jgi:hypothetical protein